LTTLFEILSHKQLLLQAPENLGAVMLDDSFFYENGFGPPDHLRDTFLVTSYARNRSRTTGAYLLSQKGASMLLSSGTFIPAYGPIDHQLQSSIIRSGVLTHWVIPPMTCAGSQGILQASSTGGHVVYSEQRLNCQYCCNRYYNASDGWKPFQSIELREVFE
jgi:hypothetical protein